MFAALAVILAVTIPPAPRDFIADQAEILTDKRDILVMQASAQLKGVNLGVITFNELDDEPKAVAVRTLNYWQMTPDSVLVLISLNPRKIYLQPGSNYASIFNESVATGITRGMVPYMKRRDFSGAVAYAFVRVEERLGERPAPRAVPAPAPRVAPAPYKAPATNDDSFPLGTVFLVFLGVAGTILLIRWVYVTNKRKQEEELHEYKMQWRATKGFTEDYKKPGEIKTYTGPVEPEPKRVYPTAPAAPAPVIVNSGGNNDFLTGMLIGNALSHDHHHHDTVREVVRERPAPSYSPPAYDPPSYSSSYDSGSSGGGGSDWGSSGGGFDSGGGGGGGSDW